MAGTSGGALGGFFLIRARAVACRTRVAADLDQTRVDQTGDIALQRPAWPAAAMLVDLFRRYVALLADERQDLALAFVELEDRAIAGEGVSRAAVHGDDE